MSQEKVVRELRSWERLPDEPIEKYMARLYQQTDGYNTFADTVRYQPQALCMLQRFTPELLSAFEGLQTRQVGK